MSCPVCKDVVERSDIPHVIRKCSGCGREMHIFEPGEHGRGMMIRAGDRPVIPAGWLKFSPNPLQSSGHLSRAGLDMVAKQFFLGDLFRKEETYAQDAAALERETDEI